MKLICYTENAVCNGMTTFEMEQKLNLALQALTSKQTILCLAAHKTEAVPFTTCRQYNLPSFRLKKWRLFTIKRKG